MKSTQRVLPSASLKSRRKKTAKPNRRRMLFEMLEDRRLLIVSAINLDTTSTGPGALPLSPGTGYDGVVLIRYNNGAQGSDSGKSLNPDYICTGSLLETGKHILTAAHCVGGYETHVIDLGNPTGGTFQVKYDGQTTATLNYNATPQQIQAA